MRGALYAGQPLRPYQAQACAEVERFGETGIRSVLLVAPTGAGKTRMAEEFVYLERERGGTIGFIVHRRELLRQAAAILRKRFPALDVGIIGPGEELDLAAPIQVATVQTLLARGIRPNFTLFILDECHHYAAALWIELAQHYRLARTIGLTATPERQDGRPLGDIFQALVVAARYPELVRDGHLVPCRVYQPPEIMGSDLAQDPLTAWQRYAEGSRTFVFTSGVDAAYELAERFRDAGIAAGTIEAKTPKGERDETLAQFAAGSLTVLTNVFALTEGVDIPAARTCMLARGCGHVGPYLQMVGRVLRPAPGKPDAILIDLSGATLVHGLPTEDREYSLDGEGIRRTSPAPLRTCLQCGATVLSAHAKCPQCGYEFPVESRQLPRIWDLELRAVYAGSDTPSDAKGREYRRLRELARQRGWSLYFVQKQYKQLFGELPVIHDATEEEMREEYQRLVGIATARNFKPGFVKIRFKEMFGKWPDRRFAA